MSIAKERRLDEMTPAQREKHDLMATYRLWHKRMRVLVPRYATLTPEQIKMYGTCYSDSMPVEDRRAYNNELTYVWMSPIRQLALYMEGIPIAYPNRLLAIEVYKDIKLHVHNWSELLGHSMNRRKKAPPVEDFDNLLEFAENLEVYLEYYYHHVQSKDFEPFHKRTLNRFVNEDKYMHRQDSTYTKLREGIYSFTGDRVARKDGPAFSRPSVQTSNSSHYQDQPILTEADMQGLDLRGGRPV